MKAPRDRYAENFYGRAIHYACDRKTLDATEVYAEADLEAARAAMSKVG